MREGGVDSSVALRLLLAAGHKCTAFYLQIWMQEDFKNFWGVSGRPPSDRKAVVRTGTP